MERFSQPEHIQDEFEEQTFQVQQSPGRKLRPLPCLCQVTALLALGAAVAVLMLHPKPDELLSLIAARIGVGGHPNSGERVEDSTLQAPLVGVKAPTQCQDWDVRLLATPELPSGTPEVFVAGRFRPICGLSFWDDIGHDSNSSVGATIFCRQLGFDSGRMTPTAHSREEEPGRGSYDSDAVFIHSCQSTQLENLSSCGADKKQPPATGSLHFPRCRAKQKVAVSITCMGDSQRLQSNPRCTTVDATNETTSQKKAMRGTTAMTAKAPPTAATSTAAKRLTTESFTKATTMTTSTTRATTTAAATEAKPVLRDVFGYREGTNLPRLQSALYRRCALVGASNSLTGKGHGDEIDAHDVVIRVNRLPNPEYWRDFGQTCNVLFLNDNLMHTGKVTLMRDGAEVLCKYLPNCKDAALIFRDDWGPCEPERLQREWGSTHPFVGCPHMNFTKLARRFSIMYDQPSTGFLAYITFAPLCKELNVYGFAGRSTADHHVEWKGHPLETEHRLEHEIANGEWSKIQYKKHEIMDKWFAKHATNVNMILE